MGWRLDQSKSLGGFQSNAPPVSGSAGKSSGSRLKLNSGVGPDEAEVSVALLLGGGGYPVPGICERCGGESSSSVMESTAAPMHAFELVVGDWLKLEAAVLEPFRREGRLLPLPAPLAGLVDDDPDTNMRWAAWLEIPNDRFRRR